MEWNLNGYMDLARDVKTWRFIVDAMAIVAKKRFGCASELFRVIQRMGTGVDGVRRALDSMFSCEFPEAYSPHVFHGVEHCPTIQPRPWMNPAAFRCEFGEAVIADLVILTEQVFAVGEDLAQRMLEVRGGRRHSSFGYIVESAMTQTRMFLDLVGSARLHYELELNLYNRTMIEPKRFAMSPDAAPAASDDVFYRFFVRVGDRRLSRHKVRDRADASFDAARRDLASSAGLVLFDSEKCEVVRKVVRVRRERMNYALQGH